VHTAAERNSKQQHTRTLAGPLQASGTQSDFVLAELRQCCCVLRGGQLLSCQGQQHQAPGMQAVQPTREEGNPFPHNKLRGKSAAFGPQKLAIFKCTVQASVRSPHHRGLRLHHIGRQQVQVVHVLNILPLCLLNLCWVGLESTSDGGHHIKLLGAALLDGRVEGDLVATHTCWGTCWWLLQRCDILALLLDQHLHGCCRPRQSCGRWCWNPPEGQITA